MRRVGRILGSSVTIWRAAKLPGTQEHRTGLYVNKKGNLVKLLGFGGLSVFSD